MYSVSRLLIFCLRAMFALLCAGYEMTTGVVGYTCGDADNPCSQGAGVYPHVIVTMYIECVGTSACYELDCPSGRQWNQALERCESTWM